jgi:hypothetical protein
VISPVIANVPNARAKDVYFLTMRGAYVTLCVFTFVALGWSTNFRPCKFGDTIQVGTTEGIRVQRVTLLEGDQKFPATALVPSDPEPVPGIIFSHSEIVGASSKVDLLRFAMALARAGAASIVLDGSINWNPPNDDSARSPHLWACSGQWLLVHVNLDRDRLAQAGPNLHWGGGDTPLCMVGESPCWTGGPWLNFGQTSAAEFRNTEKMLRVGCATMASFAQRVLRLRPVEPKWLGVVKYTP